MIAHTHRHKLKYELPPDSTIALVLDAGRQFFHDVAEPERPLLFRLTSSVGSASQYRSMSRDTPLR